MDGMRVSEKGSQYFEEQGQSQRWTALSAGRISQGLQRSQCEEVTHTIKELSITCDIALNHRREGYNSTPAVRGHPRNEGGRLYLMQLDVL